MTGDVLLAVEDLAIEWRGQELLSDVSLTVTRGGCTAVAGESGSGKSLTCRAITGTLPMMGGRVSRGGIAFDGRTLDAHDEKSWRALRGRRIGLVPQGSLSGLNPVRRIGKQLVETIRLVERRGNWNARAEELLTMVALAEPDRVLRAYPHELSGGMRQRVMIALALACRPDLLVADEATTALDVTVQREILELLGDLRRQMGLSVIIVTHDLGVVETVADAIVIMYAGQTIEVGDARQVLSDPFHPYTKALLRARPALLKPGERLDAIRGSTPGPSEWPSGCRFAPRCALALDACRGIRPRLEDAGDEREVACVRWAERTSTEPRNGVAVGQ
jgi:peptide/nickel transport system ATP-binding protein